MQTKNQDPSDELIIMNLATMKWLLKYSNKNDVKFERLLALYCFYYHTAKTQKTNIAKATANFVAKGLGWGKKTVIKYKKELVKMGLIESITRKDEETRQIKGHYVKVNYVYKTEPETPFESQRTPEPPCGLRHPVADDHTNAYYKSKMLNNKDKRKSSKEDFIDPPPKPNQEKKKNKQETGTNNERDPLTQLPPWLADKDSGLARLVSFYSALFKHHLGAPYRVTNWGAVGKHFKPLLEDYSEFQIAAIIIVHFLWHGTSGTDTFEHKRLREKGFPILWIPRNFSNYEAFLRTHEDLDFDKPREVKNHVVRYIKREEIIDPDDYDTGE